MNITYYDLIFANNIFFNNINAKDNVQSLIEKRKIKIPYHKLCLNVLKENNKNIVTCITNKKIAKKSNIATPCYECTIKKGLEDIVIIINYKLAILRLKSLATKGPIENIYHSCKCTICKNKFHEFIKQIKFQL